MTMIDISDFTYIAPSLLTAFASDLSVVNSHAFFIKGKNETIHFQHDYTSRDVENDIRFWCFTGMSKSGKPFRVKIFND